MERVPVLPEVAMHRGFPSRNYERLPKRSIESLVSALEEMKKLGEQTVL